jgi:hypothetical protein
VEHPPYHWKDKKGKALNDQMEAPIPGAGLHSFDCHGQPLNEEDQCYPDIINQVGL